MSARKLGRSIPLNTHMADPGLFLDDRLCCRDVSPRLSAGALAEWMWAYLAGIRDSKTTAGIVKHQTKITS